MNGLPARFWAKVQIDASTECWQWIAANNGEGYGRYWHNGRLTGPHRVAYETLVGPIPEGLELDHLCRNTACVNPEHLEPVDRYENARRAGAFRPESLRTHCPQGHEYSPENTRVSRRRRGNHINRICKTCEAASQQHRRRIPA